MSTPTLATLPDLYEQDETAWLEAMSDLVREGRGEDLDLPNLADYLSDMAERDRREVECRLTALLMHILEWEYQLDHRSRSGRGTLIQQRQELKELVGRRLLHNHAEDVLRKNYLQAVERAAAKTGLVATCFPTVCPWTLDQLLAFMVPETEE